MAKNGDGNGRRLDLPALENWLWEAACVVRGPLDAPKYKDYILPLVFLKRLSDVFDEEIAHLAKDFGDEETALKLVQQDHKLVRFFLPKKARWPTIAEKTTGLGEHPDGCHAVGGTRKPPASGVIDATDYNATTAGQRIVDDARLAPLVQVLNNPDYRLGLARRGARHLGPGLRVPAAEVRRGSGPERRRVFHAHRGGRRSWRASSTRSRGPPSYDPCCGVGGLLIKCHLRLLEKKGKRQNGRLVAGNVAPLKLFGQEIEGSTTFAIARMNAFIHDMEAEIMLGDTMHRPAFTEGDGRLRQFDLVTANPMWNQKFPAATYENDPYERFNWGTPPSSSRPIGDGSSTWPDASRTRAGWPSCLDTGA